MRVQASVQTISPEKAKQMIAQSGDFKNRTLVASTVNHYASVMARGLWKINGEPIILNCDGSVLDGQHRLHGVVKSGVTIQTLVVSGVDQKTFDTMGKGRRRSNSDTLSIAGHVNVNDLSAAAGLVYCYARNYSMGKSWKNGLEVRNLGPEIVPFVEHNPGLIESVRETKRMASVEEMRPTSLIAALYYLFGIVEPGMRNAFFDEVRENTGTAGTGTYALIQANRNHRCRTNMKLSQEYKAAVWVKAWNHYARGTQVTVLKWNDSESFPKITGLTPQMVTNLLP